MSPTEFDLRAALHDGESEGPDPDLMLAAGRARASARRSRIAAVTGAVVAVLAVGTTGGILLSRDTNNGPSTADAGRALASPAENAQKAPRPLGSASENAPTNVGPAAAPGPTSSPSSSADNGSRPAAGAGSTAAEVRCPSTFGTGQLPGGGGSGQPAARGSLFRGSIKSVVVCGYGSTGSADTLSPGRLVLTGSDATGLATSLNDVPTTRPAVACPDFRVADDHRLVFLAVTTAGVSAPISTTLGNPSCDVQVTNGTQVRYGWSPPADLRTKLFAIEPK